MFSNTLYSEITLRLQKWRKIYFARIIWHHGFWCEASKFFTRVNYGTNLLPQNISRLYKTCARPKWLKYQSSIMINQSHRILSCTTARIPSDVGISHRLMIIECTTIQSHCIKLWLHCTIGSVCYSMVCAVSIRYCCKQTSVWMELQWSAPKRYAFNQCLIIIKHANTVWCRYYGVDFSPEFSQITSHNSPVWMSYVSSNLHSYCAPVTAMMCTISC